MTNSHCHLYNLLTLQNDQKCSSYKPYVYCFGKYMTCWQSNYHIPGASFHYNYLTKSLCHLYHLLTLQNDQKWSSYVYAYYFDKRMTLLCTAMSNKNVVTTLQSYIVATNPGFFSDRHNVTSYIHNESLVVRLRCSSTFFSFYCT